MNINLYNTLDTDEVLNKSLVLKHEVDIKLKTTTNVMQPIIILYESIGIDLSEVNYAYLPEFQRYYFIRSKNLAPNDIYEMLLECDVLETYKNVIMNSRSEITRPIRENDFMDGSITSEVRKDVKIYKSNKGFKDERSIIFSTIGHDIGEGA